MFSIDMADIACVVKRGNADGLERAGFAGRQGRQR